jgi:chlorobactene glucosyltransferase
MLEISFYLSFIPLLFFALVAILNTFTFPRLRRVSRLATPRVSVLIPMRNEAAVIGATVASLLAQAYPNFEIWLLDDQSTDDSAKVALAAAGGDPRLTVLTGKPLPAGWLGKNWACQQLAERAGGDYLLFTDADVRWEPGALSALMAEAASTRADLLTAWPRQVTLTWGERLVVPLMGFSILAYLPALAVHSSPWPVFAAAIGQCLLFKRSAYEQIGGHAAIKQQITDDMACAYAIKRQKLRFRMADGADFLACRMYRSWAEVRNGYAKNILAGHGDSLAFLAFSTLFHWWEFIGPWLWLFGALFAGGRSETSPYVPALFIALGLLTRALTAAFTRQRVGDAVFMPISVLLMTAIAWQGVKWHFNGGPQWKGRQLNLKTDN